MANLNGSTETKGEKSETEARVTTTKPSATDDELNKVSEFFEANSGAIERWLKEKAPDDVINQLNTIVSKHRVCEKEHRSSVTSELYQQWLSSSSTPLKVFKLNDIIVYSQLCINPLNCIPFNQPPTLKKFLTSHIINLLIIHRLR